MNDNSPCVVYTKKHGYSEVLTKKKAIELAMKLAGQGCQVWVSKLVDYTYYGGLSK